MCANTNSPVVNLRDNRKQKNPEKNKRMKELEVKEDMKKPFAGRSIGSGSHAGTIVAIVISCEVAPGVNDARFCL
jgi:hypothetical protein